MIKLISFLIWSEGGLGHLMGLHSFIFEGVADLSWGRRLSAGTCVSVHVNTERCQWSLRVSQALPGLKYTQPSVYKQKHKWLSFPSSCSHSSRLHSHCAPLSPVSLIRLVEAPSKKTQPSDVYSHRGLAIKMMNELTAHPCKKALRGKSILRK